MEEAQDMGIQEQELRKDVITKKWWLKNMQQVYRIEEVVKIQMNREGSIKVHLTELEGFQK